MAFATGRHMCAACIRVPFEADHVVAMVRACYADRVQFHDGEGEVAPRRDASTASAAIRTACRWCASRRRAGRWCIAVRTPCTSTPMSSTGNPFPIIFDLGAMTQGWRSAKKLAGGDETPRHSRPRPGGARPLPAVPGQDGEVVALHLPPLE